MKQMLCVASVGILALGAVLIAQERVASPEGTAATEIGGRYVNAAEPDYQGGKWIEITSGRPIKRGRELWGSGSTYGQMLDAGAPVWRAGANVSTRLKTELPIVIGGKSVAVGSYSLFIDLKPNAWTFIVSNWGAQRTFDPRNGAALWGSFGYTPAKDVVRARMTAGTLPFSVDQLTWAFVDMSDAGGKIAIMWDKTIATVPFTRAGR